MPVCDLKIAHLSTLVHGSHCLNAIYWRLSLHFTERDWTLLESESR